MAFIYLKNGTRVVRKEVPVALESISYGIERFPIKSGMSAGGTMMHAILGPDQSETSRFREPGTPTNNDSLQPLMKLLNKDSAKNWIAGHLLNADLGGSGTLKANLTPLTHAANSAHKHYEAHIKRMLLMCYNIDFNAPADNFWYGVEYSISVSSEPFNSPVDEDLMDTYCSSFITLNYGFVRRAKTGATAWVPVAIGDPQLSRLSSVLRPNCAPSPNIKNYDQHTGTPGVQFRLEIHNEA